MIKNYTSSVAADRKNRMLFQLGENNGKIIAENAAGWNGRERGP